MHLRACDYLFLVLLSSFPASFAQSIELKQNRQAVLANFASLPLAFEQNSGQVESDARFILNATGYSAQLSPGEMRLVFNPISNQPKAEMVRIRLAKANQESKPEGIDPLPGVTNYYTGNDPAHWKTDIRQFRQVRYRNIYQQIDLVLYGNQRQLEF